MEARCRYQYLHCLLYLRQVAPLVDIVGGGLLLDLEPEPLLLLLTVQNLHLYQLLQNLHSSLEVANGINLHLQIFLHIITHIFNVDFLFSDA